MDQLILVQQELKKKFNKYGINQKYLKKDEIWK